ncbi:unnamed protein product [Candidula unifasciata]|uniref:ARID domain-containing protein n=1 Tax=Candidula unifasciata TaxID=100452 RepID=A0A8S3ZL57_9EUPU|nr:unnamed protein product [Candidula unifasciata]
MSQGRRPMLGAVGGSYLQPGGQYMNQQLPMGPGSSAGPPHQRFMMMPNHMYGHSATQPQMYMNSSQQQSGPSLSPVGRPLTPQQPQLQHMQNMVQSSPSQLSPVPSVTPDHGVSHESNPEDPSGENSRSSIGVPQPSPSPVGSTGSRSNTPASISGARAGSPMPIRPPGQVDGQSRFTQSPMATQGFGQHIMPPPNSMAYMPTSGKMGGGQIPGHVPQYGTQFPQGNYSRQPNMATGGPPQPGSMQSYPGSQPGMYSSNPSQMPGAPMYGTMPGMVRNLGQQAYNPSPGQGPYPQSNTSMGGMMNSHYPGYNSSHMGPMAGHHSMQQAPVGSGHMPPGSAVGPVTPMGGQQGGMMPQQHMSSKGAPAGMLTAAGSVGPRMSHNRGSMSPSRGMFMQSGEGPLAHMNNMMNSPNLGHSNLTMNSNNEQLSRSGSIMGNLSTSTPSPVPHFPAALTNTSTSVANSGDHGNSRASPLTNAEAHDSMSRPGSVAARHPDLPNESTMGSDSSGGMPSDSTSVDSGFHSSDQSDKTSDSVSTPTQSVSSPLLTCHPANGDASRTLENITPPDHTSHPPPHHLQHHHHLHQQHMQQHYHMDPEPKMPYSSDGGVPLPPAAISIMPLSSSSVVTTANAGPSLTSVTQSIASPVASISTSIPPNHPHPHTHHMGPHGGPPHMMTHGMGPGTLGMMPNGMPSAGMTNPGQLGGHNHLRPGMGGPMPGMMPPNMGGPNMNVNQNGPLMGPMMSHNGPMMPGHLGMNSGGNNPSMLSMGQMPPQQQMNCMPAIGNTKSSSKNTSEETPGRKKKAKESENQGGHRAGSMGHHFSEEPNSPGALKNALDLNKLFEMGPEPDRRHFLERIFAFLEESGQPVTALPVISKTPLDLYKLYFSVKERGGFEEITRSKKWRDICTAVNIGTSASAAFTLKKNYIRYLFNYECKFDRGGIDPAPILAQMEAQLAHKREQKKRAPSPAGSNSNDSFRPPSVPNNQMDPSYQTPNMPPPYMQNQDGSMPDPHVMMGSGGMMGGPGPHGGMGSMMGGPQGARPSGMMAMSGAGMMHRQQGMIPNSGPGNMVGSQMPGGPPGYGGPMMQQPMSASGPPFSSHGGLSAAGPMPVTSDSITAQDPFAIDSGYLQQQRGGPLQPTPPPQSLPTSTPLAPGYPGSQPSTMGNTALTNTSSQSGAPAAGFPGPDQMMGGFVPNAGPPTDPPVSTSSGQFGFGQQFERSDRFDQSNPSMLIRQSGPTPGMTPAPQPPVDGSPAYPGTRFQTVGMRPQGGDVPGQYPQPGNAYQNQGGYPGPQYPGYPQNAVGPRPPHGSGGIYGTPTKRFSDDQPDRIREGQWSPMQRSHGPQNGPGYMSPAAPSTPPMGQYCQQLPHKNSPHRDAGRYLAQQKVLPSHGGMAVASFARKEITFPADSIESVGISTARRKKLTSKDLAPFESWRLMMALKSGLLAESTWALDTLNILLYDDTTVGYFGLNKLPGLLEVLTDHLRHCLMQMFSEFEDLEEGLARKNISHDDNLNPLSLTMTPRFQKEELNDEVIDERKPTSFFLSGSNYTMVSRKGLPVKIDANPVDSSVLDSKDWDVFCNFHLKSHSWATGCGDITKHILTHLESSSTNTFLAGRFRRKRTRKDDDSNNSCSPNCEKGKKNCPSGSVLASCGESKHCSAQFKEDMEVAQCATCDISFVSNTGCVEGSSERKSELQPKGSLREGSSSGENNSMDSCVGVCGEEKSACIDSAQPEVLHISKSAAEEVCAEADERSKSCSKDSVKEKKKRVQKMEAQKGQGVEVLQSLIGNTKGEFTDTDAPVAANSKLLENGDVEEPKLSPVLSCESAKAASDVIKMNNSCELNISKGGDSDDNCSNSSPPVLRAESVDGGDVTDEATSETVNSTVNGDSNVGISMKVHVSTLKDSFCSEEPKQIQVEVIKIEDSIWKERNGLLNQMKVEVIEMEESMGKEKDGVLNDSCGNNSVDVSQVLNESFTSESEELSASIVAEMLKEDEHLEEEAFQRDDPPLCVTPESKDELGRRCVCISNIIRSLSCIPGNEERICKHAGTMRILGRLMLLHHIHPVKPPARKLPSEVEEEEDREQLPRVYDDEHWWWDYLDQLRENALVIMANICGHLKLADFPEQICFPLLEGLLHWVICPASVAKDPLPTLPAGSVLSPQRLVLEALCKLCIHETNVDLLLATPPVKRILELFGVLVRLLADRNHQITREFSIVLLSLLVAGESSAARAVALQHASVSLLVDFLETAEQNALTIANQQGIEVLQVNPEVMGTSLDMLRRAASILLHMARVPDNHKLFVQQQNRLLNLVMSQILDQTVSNTLSEVLFECSQVS